MRCHHECGSVRSTCTLNARCAPRIGVVLGELHVVVRVHIPLVVCDDAVVRRTLVLIALVVIVVFVVAIFLIEICCMGDILFTPPVGDSELLLAVTEF